MPLKSQFDLLAHYNRWMNEKLYDAASKLDAAGLHDDKGAFFGSVFGTLNHLLEADTIWMKRFVEVLPRVTSTAFIRALPHPYTLSAPLHADFQGLRETRATMDAAITECFAAANEDVFGQPLTWTNRTGQRFSMPFEGVVQHFFNHQTHHRGQATTLFSQAGIDVGVTDLLALVPDAGEA